MTVITISRQCGSGGNEIADLICRELNYHPFDKRLIEKAARDSGLSEQEIVDYTEDNYKVRNFLDRLFNRTQTLAQATSWFEERDGTRRVVEHTLTEDMALILVQKAIRSAHRAGDVVLVGRGGQAVLKDEPDVLHVRIVASMEDRIQRLKQQLKERRQSYPGDISLRRDAQDYIIEHDAASADYLKRFYNIDLNDAMNYHMVLNTSKVPIKDIVSIIIRAVQHVENKVIEAVNEKPEIEPMS